MLKRKMHMMMSQLLSNLTATGIDIRLGLQPRLSLAPVVTLARNLFVA